MKVVVGRWGAKSWRFGETEMPIFRRVSGREEELDILMTFMKKENRV